MEINVRNEKMNRLHYYMNKEYFVEFTDDFLTFQAKRSEVINDLNDLRSNKSNVSTEVINDALTFYAQWSLYYIVPKVQEEGGGVVDLFINNKQKKLAGSIRFSPNHVGIGLVIDTQNKPLPVIEFTSNQPTQIKEAMNEFEVLFLKYHGNDFS